MNKGRQVLQSRRYLWNSLLMLILAGGCPAWAQTNIDVTVGGLDVLLKYQGQSPTELGTSPIFTANLENYGLLARFSDRLQVSSLRPGAYTLNLAFAGGGTDPLLKSLPVTITGGQTNPIVIDLCESLGLVVGKLTINGQPPRGFDPIYRVTGRTRAEQLSLLQTNYTGVFKLLLPAGHGSAEVRSSDCTGILRSFQFDVAACQTTDVGVIALESGGLNVRLLYQGQPPSTLGSSPIFTTDLVEYGLLIPAIDKVQAASILPGAYNLKLTYQSGGTDPLVKLLPVTIIAGQTNFYEVDLCETLGVVVGKITVNGQPPRGSTPRYQVLGRTRAEQTVNVQTNTGAFKLLLPAGVGTGEVRSSDNSGVLRTLQVFVFACQTTDLGVIAVDTGGLDVRLTYQGQPLEILGTSSPTFTANLEGYGFLGPFTNRFLVPSLLAGDYTLKIAYQAGGTDPVVKSMPVSITGGLTNQIQVDLCESLGLVMGQLTINRKPPRALGPKYSVEARTRAIQTVEVRTNTGIFRALLPAGSGRGFVRSSESTGNLTTFPFTVVACQTEDLGIISLDSPPILSRIADQTTLEDHPTAIIPFTVQDDQTPADQLQYLVSAAHTNLVPAGNFALAGIGANRTLIISPAPDQFGVTTVDLAVVNEYGLAASNSFLLTVLSVNDAPSFTLGPDVTVEANSGGTTMADWASQISVGPANETGQRLSFQVDNNHPALFSRQPSVSPVGTLIFTPATNASGSAQVTVRLRDDGGVANGGQDTSAAQTRIITVKPMSVPPAPALLLGQVTDAVTGEPLPGASVRVLGLITSSDARGFYAFSNLVVQPLTVDFDAEVRMGPAPLRVQFVNLTRDPAARLEGSKAGYLAYTNGQVQILPGETNRFDFSLSPANVLGLRLVLNWGRYPDDLDANLVAPVSSLASYHVWYALGHRGDTNGPPYASLDVDVRNGFGPETITITRLLPGLYHYYVHNYWEFQQIAGLTNSSAAVQIYDHQGLLRTIYAPPTGEGDYWDVCTIDGDTGAIQVINQIAVFPPVPTAASAGRAAPRPILMSTPLARRYLWDFGDGATSTAENPQKTYETPGEYTVTLRVTIPGQPSYDLSKSRFIVVTGTDAAVPRLTINRSAGLAEVKWSAANPTFKLESTPQLSGATWFPESFVPTITSGTNYTITVPAQGTRYFRLRQELTP